MGISLSSDEKVFVCVDEDSPFGGGDFPTTPDALSRVSRSWNLAGYAGKGLRGTFSVLSSDGSKLLYSTYLTQKTPAGEWASATPAAMGLVDPKGKEVYLLGQAYGAVPTTPDAFDRKPSNYPCRTKTYFMIVDWAHKFKIRYSSFLPPFLDMKDCHKHMGWYSDIRLLGNGKLVLTGTSISNDFQTTPQAVFPGPVSWTVPFISLLDMKEKKVLYASYGLPMKGGTYTPRISGVRNGCLVFAGVIGGNWLPVTPNAFSKVFNLGKPPGQNIPYDCYVASMPLEAPGVTRKGKSTWYKDQVPTLYVKADPKAGEKNFGFECWNAPPSSSGVLLVSRKTSSSPSNIFGARVYLDLSSGLWPFGMTTGPKGKASLTLPLPLAAKGLSFAAQALWANPAPYNRTRPLSATAALEVTVQ
ncbi:MAG TPA: hypothetical protein ENJ97_01515 [Planctomycetes bacterium]|nr:hypothetical protein [Planctomycetota bacterium]